MISDTVFNDKWLLFLIISDTTLNDKWHYFEW